MKQVAVVGGHMYRNVSEREIETWRLRHDG